MNLPDFRDLCLEISGHSRRLNLWHLQMWLCLLSIVLLLSNEAEGDKLNAVEGETYNLQLYVYDNSFCYFDKMK